MPELRITLLVEQDGEALPNMPIIKRLIVAEAAGPVSISAAADNNTTSYHPIAAGTMPQWNFFLLESDLGLNLQINQAGTSNPLPLQSAGLLLIVGTQLAQATPADNIEFNNPAVSQAANLTIVVGGT